MTRHRVFALATALTLIVFTGAFALLGFAHRSPSVTPAHATPLAAHVVPATTAQRWDD